MKKVLGIDIGGSGVKGAIVDTKTGKFLTERLRVPTPKPYSLEGLLDAIDEIIKTFNWYVRIFMPMEFPLTVQGHFVRGLVK